MACTRIAGSLSFSHVGGRITARGERRPARAMVAERDAQLAAVSDELKTARLEIEQMKQRLAVLLRQRYGQSSEKLDREVAQLQMRLEELEENVAEETAAHARRSAAEQQEQPAVGFRPKPPGRRPLPAHLPREIVVHEPDITCHCNNCDPARLVKLGGSATEVLDKIPARLKVIRHLRPKYACRVCETIF